MSDFTLSGNQPIVSISALLPWPALPAFLRSASGASHLAAAGSEANGDCGSSASISTMSVRSASVVKQDTDCHRVKYQAQLGLS